MTQPQADYGVPAPPGTACDARSAALHSVGRAAARGVGIEQLFRLLHRELSRCLDATGFILGLYDDASQTVTIVRQMDSGKELPGGSFPLGDGFTSRVIRSGEPLLVRRWSEQGPRVQMQYATDRAGLPQSGLTVPLMLESRVLGVISLQSYEPDAYDERDLRLMETIAPIVASAVQQRSASTLVDDAFRRRLSELETVLAAMSDALIVVGPDGSLAWLNRAAREVLGVNEREAQIVLGQPLGQGPWNARPFASDELMEMLERVAAEVCRGEAIGDMEIEVDRSGRRVLSVSGHPLRDAAGALNGGAIVVRDVTTRRVVERLKDEVLSIASHDLRSPATLIGGHAQRISRLIKTGAADAGDVAEALTTIEHESGRLTAMLDLLLDFSRLESGRLEMRPERVDLSEIARRGVESMKILSERHELVLEAPPQLEGLWDGSRLEQVLQNLLSNALKYSPDGGRVVVSIGERGDQVEVRVRDEGVGLAPEEISQIFDRFYRSQEARRLEGSGLGLYICRAIVIGHGGTIWAESDGPGHGCTLCFTLPRKGHG